MELFIIAKVDGQEKVIANSSGEPRMFPNRRTAHQFIRNRVGVVFDSARITNDIENISKRLRVNS